MRARLTWVLLLVAAVFAMHGPLSLAPDTAQAVTVALMDTPSTPTDSPSEAVETRQHAGSLNATAQSEPHESAPKHEPSAHIWSLCLAVLATGMAVVGWWVVTRKAPQATAALPTQVARAVLRFPELPRPPDLSALCLLRI